MHESVYPIARQYHVPMVIFIVPRENWHRASILAGAHRRRA